MSILKISRLESLIDGVFAIAMTILVFDLKLPVDGTQDLHHLLLATIPYKLFIYVGSFIILGTLWVAMNFQWGLLQRVNRPYFWTNILYLMVICLIPFSASLVATYPESKKSIIFFAVNLLCANAAQLLVNACAYYFNLNNERYNALIHRAIIKRALLAPAFYIAAIIVAFWSIKIAFIIMIAPIILYLIPGEIDRHDRA